MASHFRLTFRDLPSLTLPDDDFFRAPYPATTSEYLAFCDGLKQHASAWHPSDAPWTVDIVQRWRSLDLPCLRTNLLPPEYRPVPEVVRHASFTQQDQEVILAMYIPLQTGPQKWGQVWHGTMNVRSLIRTESRQGLAPAPVVVKIFQESLFEDPSLFEPEMGIAQGGWLTGAQQARREAWAYSSTRSLQGREVPWSYGMFKFRLSHGELAFAHVMECVEGQLGKNVSLRDSSEAQLWLLADAISSGFYKMIECGILHFDLSLRNIIIRLGSSYPVVFLDLTFAFEYTESMIDDGVISLMIALRDMGADMYVIKAWLDDRVHSGLPWSRMFVRGFELRPHWFDHVSDIMTPQHRRELFEGPRLKLPSSILRLLGAHQIDASSC
ncbi:hypothetical protein BKA93DRAFT_753419 [Sparassis latifolia]